ncbi:hypothetical protein, partial [Vibrio parahaemolyticus]
TIFNLNHIPDQEYIFDNISVVLGKTFRKFFLLIEQRLPLFDNTFYSVASSQNSHCTHKPIDGSMFRVLALETHPYRYPLH